MKIVDIEVINLCYPYPPDDQFVFAGGIATGRLTTLVKVHTDTQAIGLGTTYSHPMLVRTVIEQQLKPFLLGEDPTEVEALWDRMYRITRWYGRKGAAMSALGALDIAFWDLRGKALGKSVATLLGAERDTVPAYASALLWKDDPQALGDEAASYVEQGFRRVKMRLGRSEEYDVAAVRAVRRAVGDRIDVIVDGSMRYSPDQARTLAKVLAEERVFWFEEPFPPEEIEHFAALRPEIRVPLAAGENEFGVQGFRELLRAGAVDIVQPDACRAGGISECYRVGELAAHTNTRVATHTWSDAVALVANMHVIAALANGITVEVDRTGTPFMDSLLVEPLTIRDGMIRLPAGPGLGIELAQHEIETFILAPGDEIPDGNFSDMVFGRDHFRPAPPYGTETNRDPRVGT